MIARGAPMRAPKTRQPEPPAAAAVDLRDWSNARPPIRQAASLFLRAVSDPPHRLRALLRRVGVAWGAIVGRPIVRVGRAGFPRQQLRFGAIRLKPVVRLLQLREAVGLRREVAVVSFVARRQPG